MNETHPTQKKPARATASVTALLVLGMAVVGAIIGLPTAAAIAGEPKPDCYEDYVSAVTTQYHPCGPCRPGDHQYYSVGGITIWYQDQHVHVPRIIWWDKCDYRGGSDLAGQPVEGVPLPTGG